VQADDIKHLIHFPFVRTFFNFLFTIIVFVSPQDLHGCRRRLLTGRWPGLGAPLSCRVQWRETLRPSSCGPKMGATSTAAGSVSVYSAWAWRSRRWRPTTRGPTSAKPPTALVASTSTTPSSSSVSDDGLCLYGLSSSHRELVSPVARQVPEMRSSQGWCVTVVRNSSLIQHL